MSNIKILFYDRIGVSEETDVNNIKKSKECNICHYCIFQTKPLIFNLMFSIDAIIY